MPEPSLRLLILGAHPDDAEFHAAGTATIYRQLGHVVKMVSVTDGSAGHYRRTREELREIRRREARASAALIGAECEVWEFLDGELEPTLEVRRRIIAAIRSFHPDLVLTHRVNDYHPDHRAVGQAVQDASFLVTVVRVVPQVPALRQAPVVAFLPDLFTRPRPLSADVVVDATGQLDTIVSMLACHQSQVYEWLPYLYGTLDQVPSDQTARRAWLRRWFLEAVGPRTERFRQAVVAAYGPRRAAEIEHVEVFEISEYGSPLDEAARRRLFPFLP